MQSSNLSRTFICVCWFLFQGSVWHVNKWARWWSITILEFGMNEWSVCAQINIDLCHWHFIQVVMYFIFSVVQHFSLSLSTNCHKLYVILISLVSRQTPIIRTHFPKVGPSLTVGCSQAVCGQKHIVQFAMTMEEWSWNN